MATAPERVKCLLVDDIEENLTALEALLQRDDVEILKAGSGPEALELLLQHSDVALALLDVQMPDMNGFELAELLRGSERTRHVPLIFITAGSRDGNWQFKGYENGAVDFLYKPVDAHALVNKANVFFELHRQKRALARELKERTEALRLNEMYMAVLSHDLRSPLTAILTAAMVLQRDPGSDRVQALAGQVQSSGRWRNCRKARPTALSRCTARAMCAGSGMQSACCRWPPTCWAMRCSTARTAHRCGWNWTERCHRQWFFK